MPATLPKNLGSPRLPLTEKQLLIIELLLENRSEGLYGLQMVSKSGGRLSRAGIYVTLHRMADRGLIEARWEELSQEEDRPRRKIYKVTGWGGTVYEAWGKYVQDVDRSDAKVNAIPAPAFGPSR